MSTITWTAVKVTDKKNKQCYMIRRVKHSDEMKKYKCIQAAKKEGDIMKFESKSGEILEIKVTKRTNEDWKISLAKLCEGLKL